MNRHVFPCLVLLSLTPFSLRAQTTHESWYPLIGSAYVDNASYSFLRRVCDEAGGRLSGTASNERALGILAEELGRFGIPVRFERYRFPGFIRGDDTVRVVKPYAAYLRAVALGYTNASPSFEAEITVINEAEPGVFREADFRGRIVLCTGETRAGRERPLRSEIIDSAAARGAKAVLFIDARGAGSTLAGTANFQGRPSRVPAFSITLEEGRRIQRLIESGRSVHAYVATHSHCAELESANAIATFPGTSGRKIVVGAHFDSWDVSQGAIDNGLGSAVLFEVARLVHRFVPDRKHTIECVWFNGEELGLWGAKKYVEKHASDDIAVMINMDMIGTPTGFNAMGNDTLLPFLRALARDLNGFGMSTEIGNQPWTNSDHMPFMMNGIPTITLHARLDDAMGRTYHDFPDTFDKVSKRYLSDAAAVVGVLVAELSRTENLGLRRRTREQTASFLRKFRLEDILRREGEWIFE